VEELFMRTLMASVLALLLATAPAFAARTQKKPEFATAAAIMAWMQGYRAHPDPDKVPDVVRAMSDLNVFKDLDTAGIYIGFTAGVIGANSRQADKLIARMFPLPPEDQVLIVRAIAYSGLPNWKQVLTSFSERMPARTVLIQRYLDGKLPTLGKLPLDNGSAGLDTLWGYYLATGSFEPVARMISILSWSQNKDNVERLTVGSMAKWTLAANATRDKELLDMLKSALAYETKTTQPILREVIEAAETFEISKIRKDAIAAIDQVKAKGPETARNYAWWGQAGQTALALGCVAAGALGHMEVGLPCVLGGAASSAALKYLAPQ
jgi:hypothetical protein